MSFLVAAKAFHPPHRPYRNRLRSVTPRLPSVPLPRVPHLRVITPPERTDQVTDVVREAAAATHIVVLPGVLTLVVRQWWWRRVKHGGAAGARGAGRASTIPP